ncbi:hypothetical protein HPC49_00540 [Pyxidicoccus fallax]|uniref:Lipoprotein n=1 Tax=Pyxidicoccus fallax TaxID=394095 RepID=A0A848L3P1_9BACT|nr:hypothetical protein [Pyxidicoccus fallax]NMO13550.1 hypothetical protein [Pyxidicoccus fallax]NPC76742.1 hypothetical protein [Pyxidicoccus fallax]
MRKLIVSLVASILVGVPSAAHAKGPGTGTLARIDIQENGVAILFAVGGWTGGVSDNTTCSGTGVVALDITTDVGRAMLSIATAARLANRTVEIFVSDTACLSVGGMAPRVIRIGMH